MYPWWIFLFYNCRKWNLNPFHFFKWMHCIFVWCVSGFLNLLLLRPSIHVFNIFMGRYERGGCRRPDKPVRVADAGMRGKPLYAFLIHKQQSNNVSSSFKSFKLPQQYHAICIRLKYCFRDIFYFLISLLAVRKPTLIGACCYLLNSLE